MTFLENLEEQFGVNQPIFIDDVVNEKYSYDVVRSMLSYYVKKGDLRRYCRGVYYIPKMSILGFEATPSFNQIIERKYIYNKDGVQGYFTSHKLLNDIGLSTQVPNDLEIVTNFEKTRKRNIQLVRRNITLRKPKIKITEESVGYLQFLDIFRYAPLYRISKNMKYVIDFFVNMNLNLDTLEKYVAISSPLIKSKLKESKFYDEFTQRQGGIYRDSTRNI